jgi:hypothetical protein
METTQHKKENTRKCISCRVGIWIDDYNILSGNYIYILMTTSQRNAQIREQQIQTLSRAIENIKGKDISIDDCPIEIFERQFDSGERYPDMDLVDPYGED